MNVFKDFVEVFLKYLHENSMSITTHFKLCKQTRFKYELLIFIDCGWVTRPCCLRGKMLYKPCPLTVGELLTHIFWKAKCCINHHHHPTPPPQSEAGDVWCLPPVWNLRAVIWFHFAISSLVLLPTPVTLSVLSFSACWPFFLNFFQKILQYFSLRDRLFCMAPV